MIALLTACLFLEIVVRAEFHQQKRARKLCSATLSNHDGDAQDNVDQKMNLYFTYESRSTLKSLFCLSLSKLSRKLNLEHTDKSEIKNLKISCRGSRSPDNTELGHFTLLFYGGWQRNVPRLVTHVHSYCSAH